MPHIAAVLYSDRAFYLNAFLYTGQNSFRTCVIRYLSNILRKDYREEFPSEELFNFYVEHECNMAFDLFVLWLSGEPPLPPEDFVRLFREMFHRTALVHCRLLEREPRKREGPVPFVPDEPSRKKGSK